MQRYPVAKSRLWSILIMYRSSCPEKLLHDDQAGQDAFGHVGGLGAAADGVDVPALAGHQLVDIDAHRFHGRPGTERDPAAFAFHGRAALLLAAKGVAAGAGPEAEGQVVAVI